MSTDSNYLGKYTSVAKVWEAYPSGGIEGNYVLIGAADEEGVRYNWNKYKRQWLNAAGIPETSAREMLEADGDVFIQNNLTVAGTLRAKRIKQPCMGLFLSSDALNAAWPEPEVGMWALVGTSFPATVWVCSTAGTWSATEATVTIDDVDLSSLTTYGIKNYVAISSTDELPENPTEAEKATGYLLGSTLYVYSPTLGEFVGADLKGTKGDTGLGYSSITTPSTPDGTVIITLTSNDTITLNFNHTHFYLCDDETEYENITNKDSATLYLIPESSS